MVLVVGMGEFIVSNQEDDIIRTFALATCVAVTVYSPIRRAAGMIHVVLPSPLIGMDTAKRPEYFAVSGVPLLINAMYAKYGCRREDLLIQMFGGANALNQQDIYMVGEKNIHAVENALFNMGLTIKKSDLRGRESRTLEMNVKTGVVKVLRHVM